jgi:NADH-quinone oxidoreductase subunit I
MNGLQLLKGLSITFGHFLDTYIQDIKAGPKRYKSLEGIKSRQNYDTKGIFTVQYPEEKLSVPEEFRFLPFLVYELSDTGEKKYRCTACGICSKVCPPQCIYIVRATDSETGKPVPSSAKFFIDVDICMNCGYCAEYCPFDAIRMDHDYEVATSEKRINNFYDKEKLGRPVSYYAEIRPTNNKREEGLRQEKLASKSKAE